MFYVGKFIVPKFKTNAHSKDQSHKNRDAAHCLKKDTFNIYQGFQMVSCKYLPAFHVANQDVVTGKQTRVFQQET